MSSTVRKLLLPVFAVASLAACESESTTPDPTPNEPSTSEVTLNASSTTDFTYYSLATGQAVQVTSPATDNSWDLAIRRYEVRLNGGIAGSKGVTAALVVDNSANPSATILGYTADNQRASFDAVTSVPSAAVFASTGLAPDLSGWFMAAGQTLVANPAKAWKVRRADGGFAVVRVSQLALSGQALGSLTLEYRLQSAGGTLGEVRTITVTPTSPTSPTRVSLASGSVVTTEGCTWDLGVTAALDFTVNPSTACNAGTFPLETTESFATLTSASNAPSYAAFISAFSGPIPFSVSASAKPPFIYNIDTQNPNRLSPTFNVYLVKSGSSTYKVQFLNYYNPAGGQSGYLTIRSAKLP